MSPLGQQGLRREVPAFTLDHDEHFIPKSTKRSPARPLRIVAIATLGSAPPAKQATCRASPNCLKLRTRRESSRAEDIKVIVALRGPFMVKKIHLCGLQPRGLHSQRGPGLPCEKLYPVVVLAAGSLLAKDPLLRDFACRHAHDEEDRPYEILSEIHSVSADLFVVLLFFLKKKS